MNKYEQAIAIGFHRMGSPVEEISYRMEIDGRIVERVIEDFKAKIGNKVKA